MLAVGVPVLWPIGIAVYMWRDWRRDRGFTKAVLSDRDERIKELGTKTTIHQLEAELLSVDFYSWIDALVLVIDYQFNGNIPKVWPGIVDRKELHESELATRLAYLGQPDNHTITSQTQPYNYFIHDINEGRSMPVLSECTCGWKHYGDIGTRRASIRAIHLKELKEAM